MGVPQAHHTRDLTPMSFEDSVLQYADQDGNLSLGDAQQLFSQHGFEFEEIYADNHDISWPALDARNAEALLAWLGY